jgi:hypothetical protein
VTSPSALGPGAEQRLFHGVGPEDLTMCTKDLLDRLEDIGDGVESGEERLFEVLRLARFALAGGLGKDPAGYLAGELTRRVIEHEAPGWAATGLFCWWFLLGKFNGRIVVKALDILLKDLKRVLALT